MIGPVNGKLDVQLAQDYIYRRCVTRERSRYFVKVIIYYCTVSNYTCVQRRQVCVCGVYTRAYIKARDSINLLPARGKFARLAFGAAARWVEKLLFLLRVRAYYTSRDLLT